jgi:hypothetical protein
MNAAKVDRLLSEAREAAALDDAVTAAGPHDMHAQAEAALCRALRRGESWAVRFVLSGQGRQAGYGSGRDTPLVDQDRLRIVLALFERARERAIAAGHMPPRLTRRPCRPRPPEAAHERPRGRRSPRLRPSWSRGGGIRRS